MSFFRLTLPNLWPPMGAQLKGELRYFSTGAFSGLLCTEMSQNATLCLFVRLFLLFFKLLQWELRSLGLLGKSERWK